MELTKKLAEIQQKLKAPKSQRNTFGNYNYRNCEDILEAVKPLLGEIVLTLTDEIVLIGDRYYVKATAHINDKGESFNVSAYARESEDKKGMDSAQITGASSSYARKYALNGLFLIDDTKDADSRDNTVKPPITRPFVKSDEPKKTDFKQQLRYKISAEAKLTKQLESDEDVVKKIIADKTGIDIKDFKQIDEEMAKDLCNLWT